MVACNVILKISQIISLLLLLRLLYKGCSNFRYYSGEKKAPILTLFIGGNHEASNYLQELPYGGWVAPNIYYLGRAGVVQFGDLRIGGVYVYYIFVKRFNN